MLKWLKQKPTDGSGHGFQETSTAVAENVTDDPLAAIQVQSKSSCANKKFTKINGGNNEIYAVSRVNPLFQEDEINSGGIKGGISPGNHSGSSGYDSGPSDDDSLNKKPQYNYINPDESANDHLFSSQEDILIHHEAAVVAGVGSYLTSNGRPILQILNQNPNYVKNIAVAINRPLTPIDESLADGAVRKVASSIPVPSRNIIATKPGDSIGVAKVLQRNRNYVQSIRIGPGPTPDGNVQRRRQNFELQFSGRKPSVTFAEKVDFVDGRTSRKTSSEQDSIVTESLLMMTTYAHQQHNNELLLQEVRAGHHKRLKSETDVIVGAQSRPDLTDFSNSLSKNRIVKQITSSSALHPSGEDAPGENNDSEEEYVNDEDRYSGERSDSSSSSKSQTPSSRRVRSISSNSSSKSAFGGIADHYAAAKEIAKEIESYSTASGKSTGISLVRDLLLSNRGRSRSSSTSSSFSFKQNKEKEQDGSGSRYGTGTLVKAVVQVQSQPGEEVAGFRNNHFSVENTPWVHPQVYVKVNGMTTTMTSTPRTQRLGHDGVDEGQDQIPIYEVLPGAARLRHDDSDSGNSTDRSPKDTRLELDDSEEGEAHFVVETRDPLPSETNQNPSKSISRSESSRSSTNGSNNDKVMIVTGDSQNMVVDLSAVPPDLREAIISGTALMTFPDGLRQLVEPGYTMITIPNDDHSPNRNSNDDYGTKNKAQFWDALQKGSPTDAKSKGYRGKEKKLTALPFHPNHDSHTTPDFTMDGHRLAIQTRKVKNGKKRRCLCRICGMVFFLAAFLGVIVTLSLIYTNGRKYFGSA